MADNVHRKSHKLLDGNKKISTPINRTTTETMRLEEPDRTHPALGLSVPSNITPANQCKKKTSSFQITSVTVGSRMSNDTGEDSNDDLDESHGEDTSVELSRITDIETPSYSEDTFSKDDVFFNASNAALSTAPVIPTSSQYGLAIVPSESGNVNNSTNNSNINTLDIASVTDNNIINLLSSNAKQDTDIREVHSHGRNERFKVVKIESTEPFKRGRWTCMDYLDHTSVNHSNTIGTPKIPDPNEVCISYGVADGGIIALDSTKSSTITEDQGISVDMNGHATHQDIHGSLAISNASTTGYQANKPISHNVQCNATSVQTSPQVQRSTQIPSQYFSSSTPQSQQLTSQQQQQQTNEQQPHQSDKLHQNEQSQQTSEQSQHQTSGQQKCDQQQSNVQQKCDPQQLSNGQSQSNMLQCDPQQQQQSSGQQQQPNNQQGSTLPTNLQNVHPNNNLGQTQSMPQGSMPIITQTNNNNVTPQQSICHAKEDAYVTSNSQNQSIPSQNICQSNTSASQANVITTSHQSQSQQQQQQQQQQTLPTRNSMPQVSEPMSTIQGMQGMQNIHQSQPQQVNTQQSGPIQGPLVSGQVLTSTSMQPQTGGANTQVQLPQVSANCQNVISAIQQGNMGFQQSDTEQDSMSGSGTAGSSQLADAALLECLVEVTQSNDDHHALEDNESMSGTSAVAIDNKIEQAMDLVKSHLMFAVREEVEVLKEKIAELMDRINQLEAENMILKAHATAETLAQLSQSSTKLPQNNSGSGQ